MERDGERELQAREQHHVERVIHHPEGSCGWRKVNASDPRENLPENPVSHQVSRR
jgi:hypothetical protein